MQKYTLKPSKMGVFLSKPRNYSVRTNTRGSTPAQNKAVSWAYQALASARTLDDYNRPTITKGSTEGQFTFFHYCEDTILSVRYDRSAGVWYAKVQRCVDMPNYTTSGFFNPKRHIIEFEIAIIAA